MEEASTKIQIQQRGFGGFCWWYVVKVLLLQQKACFRNFFRLTVLKRKGIIIISTSSTADKYFLLSISFLVKLCASLGRTKTNFIFLSFLFTWLDDLAIKIICEKKLFRMLWPLVDFLNLKKYYCWKGF